MNKALFIFFFAFISLFCRAQTNLVYNGDFELYDTCPAGYASPGSYTVQHCLGWRTPTYATSDYLNSCNTSFVSVPLNGKGYQSARSGVGYCGFYALSLLDTNFWFEYVQGILIEPLKTGHMYRICFYMSLGDYTDYAVSRLGAYISADPVSRIDARPFTYIPQVRNTIGNFITDTTNWTEISGLFIASGNEQYITIGNYNDSTLTGDTIQTQPGDGHSYYYVDDVSLTEVSGDFTNVFTPNGDGINDFIDFSYLTSVGGLAIVYNRWGVQVFKTNESSMQWDGKARDGANSNDGIYYYTIQLKSAENNYNYQKGFIQLIRS